mmetsp:Transcript_150752/g.281175  ORF Transcript_150752/g.281175 Transcript_150752/m.281175 type:complete len:482 (+) Transcript_150752:213-1658(+)
MFPPGKNKPKRIGGAPFASAPRASSLNRVVGSTAAAVLRARQPQTARGRSQRPAPTGEGSARGSENGAAYSATAPPRGDLSTPCKERAEHYFNRLLGQAQPGPQQEWCLVQEMDAVDFQAREDQVKRQDRERSVKNRLELQEQLDLQKRTAEHCRGVWKQWRVELEADVVKYQKEEEEKRAFSLEVQRRFNAERGRQLEEVRDRKNKQREAEIKLEREMMSAADAAKKRQEAADQKEKQKQKEAAVLLMKEAHSARERRVEARKAENQRDKDMAREYQELLAAQDRQRSQYFDALRDKQSKLLDAYEQGVGNALAEAAAKDEERARQQYEARLAKERQEAVERDQWRQQLAESGRVAVQEQLAAQAKNRQKAKEEEARFVAYQRRVADAQEAKEEKEKQQKQQAVYANAEYLRRQIREKQELATERPAQANHMTEVERSMNRDKLSRAFDPECADGMQALISRKRQEYRRQLKNAPTALPC